MDSKRVRIVVRGRVQGVFFRAYTMEKARSLGVVGWVKNRDDGSVEIVAEGERAKLEELLEWARQGPPDARVEEVDVAWGDAEGGFENFIIVNER